MAWKVRRTDVDFFHDELWKDIRPFPRAAKPENFAKDCFTREAAMIEASVLLYLEERLGEQCVPHPVAVEDSILIMRQIQGARLFDLIRHLKAIAHEDLGSEAETALDILLARCGERLREIQLALVDVSALYSHESYPLEAKLKGLLELFVRVLDVRVSGREWQVELEDFVEYWNSECVSVPFRDATTKNMIVADDRLRLPQDADGDQVRIESLRSILHTESEDFWHRVPIIDIDFSSIVHLTSPEDDPISLFCHEWTFGAVETSPGSFVLDSRLGSIDGERAAAAMLVRYLRFGGRKLAYRIINSQGFKVRFAYDDPSFYFERLSELCRKLSPSFVDRYPTLLGVVNEIAATWKAATRADMEHLNVDHLRKYYRVEHYWQENPTEYQL